MRAVDLFCGAGGASLGLERAGFTVTGFDYWSRAVDTHNLNGLLAYEHNLALSSCDAGIPECDLLWASPPCQPFSAAGDGEGEADERDGFPWALRIIGRLLPKVVIFENLKGITFDKHSEYFGSVLLALTGLGYEWDWRVLNAADYGVPQTRQRCFIVARRDGGRIVWPLPTHTEDAGLFTEPWVTMAAALGWPNDRMLEPNADRGVGMRERHGDRPLVPLDMPAPVMTSRPDTRWAWVLQPGSFADGRGGHRRVYDPVEEPAPSVVLGNDTAGWAWVLNTGCNWQKGQDRDAAQKIDATTQPAPTVSCISGNQWQVWPHHRPATTIAGDTRVFQPGGHHEPVEQSQNAIRLTIGELALLQGFPADYQWTGTKTDQARQVGNAVPPVMAQVLAEANRPVTA
jgi:DNA (cytosine-5)-methyltransferase 1